jgi:hypothetical protein
MAIFKKVAIFYTFDNHEEILQNLHYKFTLEFHPPKRFGL